MTSQFLHEALRSFMETWEHLLLGWTYIPNAVKLCTHGTVNKCLWRVYNASDSWLDFSMTLTLRCSTRSNWPWHAAACHFFILPCSFDHLVLGMNGKLGCTQLIVGSFQSNTHRLCWGSKMHVISKLSDLDYCVVVFSIGLVCFLDTCLEL